MKPLRETYRAEPPLVPLAIPCYDFYFLLIDLEQLV